VNDSLGSPRFGRSEDKLPTILGSRFFFAQVFFKGSRADAQHEIANLKLGLAEEVVLGLANQEPRQIGDLLIDRSANLGLKQFRFTFLFRTEMMHDHGDSFRVNFLETQKTPMLYKYSTNFRAAHTLRDYAEDFAFNGSRARVGY
jgi:hypothetical protein